MTEYTPKENSSFMSSWIKYPEKLINLCSSFNTMQMTKYMKYLPLAGATGRDDARDESPARHLYDFKEFMKYWGLKSYEKSGLDSRNGHLLTDTFNKTFPILVQCRNTFLALLDRVDGHVAACREQNETLIAAWKEASEKLAANGNGYIDEFWRCARSLASEFHPGIDEPADDRDYADISTMIAASMNAWAKAISELPAIASPYGSRDDIMKIKSDIEALRKEVGSIRDDETKAEILSLLKKDIKMMRANHNSDMQNILNAIAALRVDIIDTKKAPPKAGIKAA